MKVPKTKDDILKIINQWADCQSCDDGDEMRYFASEVLSILIFMDKLEGDL